MEDIKYPVELEVITPLSIGCGKEKEWVRGLDFVQKDGRIYVLDLQKTLAHGVSGEKLADHLQDSNEDAIIELLGNRLNKVSKFIFDSPINKSSNIKPFLRSQFLNKPIVAGSSLKGAIRSALFKHLRTTETTNEDVFGTMNDGTDFMRFIRVADTEMKTTILVNSKIFNLRCSDQSWLGGWKHGQHNTTKDYKSVGFNTLYECIEPGQKGICSVSLAGNSYDLLEQACIERISYANKKRVLVQSRINELFKSINEVTKSYLEKEKKFFERYPAERTQEIILNINELLAMIPTDGSSCLLKMSAGVGFHSITGDWQFEDYDDTGFSIGDADGRKKNYKSRKTVEYKGKLQLMGFVRLRSMAEDLKRQQALAKEREAERQKIQLYDELMKQANQLFDAGRWDDAIAKANEAARVGIVASEHQSLIERCENEKLLKRYKTEQETIDSMNFDRPLAEVLVGKSSVGNIIGTTSKWIKRGKSFTESEYQVLISCLKNMPVKEIKKKRKDLDKAISKEWADRVWGDLHIE